MKVLRYGSFKEEVQFRVKPTHGVGFTTMVDGVAVDTPSGTQLDYASGIGLENDINMPGQYAGGGGNVEQLTFISTLQFWLKWALGGYRFFQADVGEMFNKHEMYSINERLLPSFTMEGGKDYFEHLFLGCSINSLEITVEDGYIKINPTLTFAKDVNGELKEVETLQLPADKPLMFYGAKLLINNVDITEQKIVKSFNITIDNDLQQKFGIGSRFSRANTTNGRNITWGVEFEHDYDLTHLKRLWGAENGASEDGSEEVEVRVILEGKNDGNADIYLPRNIYDSVSQQPSGREEFSNSIQGKAYVGGVVLDNGETKRSSILATVNNLKDTCEINGTDGTDGGDE